MVAPVRPVPSCPLPCAVCVRLWALRRISVLAHREFEPKQAIRPRRRADGQTRAGKPRSDKTRPPCRTGLPVLQIPLRSKSHPPQSPQAHADRAGQGADRGRADFHTAAAGKRRRRFYNKNKCRNRNRMLPLQNLSGLIRRLCRAAPGTLSVPQQMTFRAKGNLQNRRFCPAERTGLV